MQCKKDGSMDKTIKKCTEYLNRITKLFTAINSKEEYSAELAARDFAFAVAEVYIGKCK